MPLGVGEGIRSLGTVALYTRLCSCGPRSRGQWRSLRKYQVSWNIILLCYLNAFTPSRGTGHPTTTTTTTTRLISEWRASPDLEMGIVCLGISWSFSLLYFPPLCFTAFYTLRMNEMNLRRDRKPVLIINEFLLTQKLLPRLKKE